MPPTPTNSRPLVSVILSFRNEAEVIPELISRLEKAFATTQVDYELVFINDASTDNSLTLLKAAIERNPRVKVINMSRRFGVAECVLAGMRYANGDAVVMMDADLQDPPELLPELILKWREGADVVYTVRTERAGESAAKMLLTKLAYKVIRLVSNTDLPVEAGDFKLISRRVFEQLLSLNEKDPYLRGLVTWMGFKQVPVFYKREARFKGETHFPLFRSKGPLITFVFGFTSFSILPLVVFLLFGLFVTLAAVVAGLVILALKIGGVAAVPKLSWFAVLIAFFSGVQLMGIGTVGLYLGRVYNDVRNRPRYLVESTLGFSAKPTEQIHDLQVKA